MIVAGGVLEVCGFVLIVSRLAILQWSAFGTPVWIVRSRGWLSALRDRLRRRPEVVHKFGSDSAVTLKAASYRAGTSG